jgi:CRP-like cAMP-binding protein
MSKFIAYLNAVSRLSEETIVDLTDKIRFFEFSKNQIILNQGQVCNYIYFVEAGLLRLFYYHEGKDITAYFASEGNLIGGIDSFFTRQPSQKIIETLEPCQLAAIHFEELEDLYAKHHDLERVGRVLSIGAFLSEQERMYDLQFHTATQRYQNLISANPTILQRVSLGHIASYLGITQVTLSRIRSQK